MDRNGSGDANIAAVASLLADPTRATIMIALSDGRALPAGELARSAHVAASTASSHLSKLAEGGLIEVESWGRHRYYRVAGPEIVGAIEALALVSPAKPVRSLRQSREAEAVRFAHTCYDHLAGFLGVKFTRSLVELDVLRELEDGYEVTEAGHLHLLEFGVDLSGRKERMRFAPAHIDWSERYRHFAGPLAKAVASLRVGMGSAYPIQLGGACDRGRTSGTTRTFRSRPRRRVGARGREFSRSSLTVLQAPKLGYDKVTYDAATSSEVLNPLLSSLLLVLARGCSRTLQRTSERQHR